LLSQDFIRYRWIGVPVGLMFQKFNYEFLDSCLSRVGSN